MPTFGRIITTRGMSFVEVLVAAAIVALVFGGLMAGFQVALSLLSNTRAQTGALALSNERLEYLRSLPYDAVGTVLGIPSGTVPQNETVTLNGITYARRTLVQYVDSLEDGFGGSDTNGITADYKRAKVEVSWTYKGNTRSVSLITNLIPKGMETVDGGGTLIANVFDASAVPVMGASVRVVNASTTSPVDVTAFTNAAGQVIFPGAPAGGGYQIFVSKSGYSSSQTYSSSSTNPNPNPSHVAVVESEVSTVNFAIDRTSTSTILTVEPPSLYQNDDTFSSSAHVTLGASTTVSGGALILATGGMGEYTSLGQAMATQTAPTGLTEWSEARFTIDTPSLTSAVIQLYSVDASGTPTLLPDAVLAGNGAGFTTSPVDISGVSALTYPRLALGTTLTTTDASTTPSVLDWLIEYEAANVPIPNIAYTLKGSKSIGTDGVGTPVLKYTTTQSTNAIGSSTVGSLEWDTYSVSVGAATGYDVADVCPRLPMALSPNTATTTSLILVPHVTRSMRVYVHSVSGESVSGASVRLSRGGYDTTLTTSACGNAFFSNPPSASDYTLHTTAPGYVADTLINVSVTGTNDISVSLTPS